MRQEKKKRQDKIDEIETRQREHLIKNDYGYKHRNKQIERSRSSFSDWRNVIPSASTAYCSVDAMVQTQQDKGSTVKAPFTPEGFCFYLRTLGVYMYYICSSVSAPVCYMWNDTDGDSGGDSITSLTHHYHSNYRTGAKRWSGWADGTNGQVWNWTFFAWMADACNPASPTYVSGATGSIYERMDVYRNDPGHTYMKPD